MSEVSDQRVIAPFEDANAQSFDLMRVGVLGRFLHWRHARTMLQSPLLIVSVLMVLHGFFGPALGPKNLATTLTWVQFRGALVLVLLLAGNFFCLACPMMLPRNIARRFFKPRLNWPRWLRNKWLSVSLLVLFLFVYELYDLWSSPLWTARLIVAYFVAAVIVDSLFKHASFCKFVCPIGQFNFVASTLSPLEVKVRQFDVCDNCKTKDCIRGRRDPTEGSPVIQRGCELALFQPLKVGNMDCTFCLDCVHACPHDNVGIISRVPAGELMTDPQRSGIGRFWSRKDIGALALIFAFGALLNAFGMVSPVYTVQTWLAQTLNIQYEVPILGLLFLFFLVIEPALLLGLAGRLTQTWGRSSRKLLPLIVRYSYALVPLGFGIWLAHYSFHFLTGLYTFIPVVQSALADIGFPVLGEPNWRLGGLPEQAVYPLELGLIGLGLLGSMLVIYRLSEQDSTTRRARIFTVWACLCVLLAASAFWLLSQPMEMRSTFLGGG